MKRKFINVFITSVLSISVWVFSLGRSSAQGQWTDNFSNNITYNWAGSDGSSASLVSGKLRVTLVSQANTNGLYSANVIKNQSITYYPGNYPVIAVKMNKPPKCNFFFDTPLGSYNNGNNNHKILYTSDGGKIYFWNLAQGTLGTTILSTTSGITLAWIKLKMYEIEANGQTSYDISWVGTYASEAALRASVTLNYTPLTFSSSGSFLHPGILHSSVDLNRIKGFVTNAFGKPYQCYQSLIADPLASSSYTVQGPVTQWSRTDPAKTKSENDCKAAYYNAHLWNITGNTAYRDKALQILNAYASTTTSTDGSADAQLNGLPAFLYVNAAEIMRYTNSGWSSTQITACENMLKNSFYPIMSSFNPRAHGAWDAICMETLMAIAIFCNDRTMYNKVGNYALNGEGNGSFRWYFLSSGQAEESNRDQAHTQLALGSLCCVAEMVRTQTNEILYNAFSKVLMTGFEYTAKYNLGNTVPFTTHYDYCEVNLSDYTPTAISSTDRGTFRPIYEMAYNHYVVRKGLSMPYTLQVKQQVGIETAPPYADHPGYGTLFFYSGSNSNATRISAENNDLSENTGWNATYLNGKLSVNGLKFNSTVGIDIYELNGLKIHSFSETSNGQGILSKSLSLKSESIYVLHLSAEGESKSFKLAVFP